MVDRWYLFYSFLTTSRNRLNLDYYCVDFSVYKTHAHFGDVSGIRIRPKTWSLPCFQISFSYSSGRVRLKISTKLKRTGISEMSSVRTIPPTWRFASNISITILMFYSVETVDWRSEISHRKPYTTFTIPKWNFI